ncbi:hypothetical protein D3C72_1441840 [compost metagenome]
MRQHDVAVDDKQLDHAAQAVGQRLAVAAVGHVQHLGAGLRGDGGHADVGDGALARGAVAHAFGMRAGVFHQTGEVFHRQRLGRHDGDRGHGHAGHRRQVLHRVVVGLGQMREDRQRTGRGQQQRGAVRLRARHEVRAHGRARARLVFDDDGHVGFLAQRVAQAAPDRVGAAAGGVGHDHGDRLGRPALRHCAACHDCQGRPRGLDQQCLLFHIVLVMLRSTALGKA